jgi:hypothetical protein
LLAFEVQERRLDGDTTRQCAHNQDELPSVARGVIFHPLWHLRFPRGGLEDAFGSSATTGAPLPRCRYVLLPESHLLPIFRAKCPCLKRYASRNVPGDYVLTYSHPHCMLHGNVCELLVLPCCLPGMLPSTQEFSERCLAGLVPGELSGTLVLP